MRLFDYLILDSFIQDMYTSFVLKTRGVPVENMSDHPGILGFVF